MVTKRKKKPAIPKPTEITMVDVTRAIYKEIWDKLKEFGLEISINVDNYTDDDLKVARHFGKTFRIKIKDWYDHKDYTRLFDIKASKKGEPLAQLLMIMPFGSDKTKTGVYISTGERLTPIMPEFQEEILRV